MNHHLVGRTAVSDILTTENITQYSKDILLYSSNHIKITQSTFTVCQWLIWRQLTFHHVAQSPAPDLFIVLVWLIQVLENINTWSKVDHVLLPTTKRHLNQWIQFVHGQGQDITCVKQYRDGGGFNCYTTCSLLGFRLDLREVLVLWFWHCLCVLVWFYWNDTCSKENPKMLHHSSYIAATWIERK